MNLENVVLDIFIDEDEPQMQVANALAIAVSNQVSALTSCPYATSLLSGRSVPRNRAVISHFSGLVTEPYVAYPQHFDFLVAKAMKGRR